MPYFLLFTLMYVMLFVIVYTYAILLSATKYERRADKQHKPNMDTKKPPKDDQGAKEPNSFTWDARTGELLEEEYIS